jgi:rhomboid family GlyGly-CTERM serine protease
MKLVGIKWALPICILIVSLLATHYAQTSSALNYDRAAILDGETYRLLTFHFVHLSNSHFLINIFTLIVLWLLYGRTMQTREWIGAIVASGCAIGLCLLLLSPEVKWSVGLSGLLYALLALAAIRSAMSGEYFSGAVVAFLLGKIILEQTIGPSAAMEQFVGNSLVVDAHMFGVIAGLVFGIISKGSDGLARSSPRRTPGLAADSGYFDGKS